MSRNSRLPDASVLPRTVVVLGLVSLLNDAASEMITPLLPIFLTATLGAGPAIVGLVEGLAEATASILKLVSGRLADRGVPAKSLVLGGYTLSNAMRPLIGLAAGWGAVLAAAFPRPRRQGHPHRPARRADRRCRPGPSSAGRAFGFHRSMDHAGSVIGPLLAFALLAAEVDLKHVFLASAIARRAGAAAARLRVAARAGAVSLPAPPRFAWGALHGRLKAMIVAAGLLALGERAGGLRRAVGAAGRARGRLGAARLGGGQPGQDADRDAGRASFPIGSVGCRCCSVAGRCACGRAAVARGCSRPDRRVWVLFMAYSATLAVTEPAERSVIGDHAAAEERGTAFGLYHLASGLLVLPGAVLFGVIWERFGSHGLCRRVGHVVAAALMWSRPGAGLTRRRCRGKRRVNPAPLKPCWPWRDRSSSTTSAEFERLRDLSSTSRW